MYIIGYDIGTSSIKATILDAQNGKAFCSAVSPKTEMPIIAKQNGWAEQDPQMWWENVKNATAEILAKSKIIASDIKAIGITYQMHGLVLVDKNQNVLRPSIIWCDSRAVGCGAKAAKKIGEQKCLENLLNLPGNFTAAKLGWVKENEPDIYRSIYKFMLPGDFIAMKMTGEINTTISGLSEGILWDFKAKQLSSDILSAFGIDQSFLPQVKDTFSIQGQLTGQAAAELGLKQGTPISYRAGDQPNNAFSLNVLEPGEIAATAGTSGVVYGVGNNVSYDKNSRVNTFAHINYTKQCERLGVLLCVNGTGILNSYLKHNIANGLDYPQMNELSQGIPVGSDGLVILPFGNGAERTLNNKDIGAAVYNLNFNTHTKAHFFRAAQEGIVFALNYGISIMQQMGIEIQTVRAGDANMFLSPVFAEAFASITGANVQLYNTDGSQGAARGAGLGAGIYQTAKQAFEGLEMRKTIQPNDKLKPLYQQAYQRWFSCLKTQISD